MYPKRVSKEDVASFARSLTPPPILKAWTVTHHGIFMSGYSVVFAHDETQARELVTSLLHEHFICGDRGFDCNDFTLREIEITPTAYLIWNGDY